MQINVPPHLRSQIKIARKSDECTKRYLCYIVIAGIFTFCHSQRLSTLRHPTEITEATECAFVTPFPRFPSSHFPNQSRPNGDKRDNLLIVQLRATRRDALGPRRLWPGRGGAGRGGAGQWVADLAGCHPLQLLHIRQLGHTCHPCPGLPCPALSCPAPCSPSKGCRVCGGEGRKEGKGKRRS